MNKHFCIHSAWLRSNAMKLKSKRQMNAKRVKVPPTMTWNVLIHMICRAHRPENVFMHAFKRNSDWYDELELNSIHRLAIINHFCYSFLCVRVLYGETGERWRSGAGRYRKPCQGNVRRQ